MPNVSPIRVIRTTRLWMPLVVLALALILFGMSAGKGRTAHQLETRGEIAEAQVLRKERRQSTDSDGNRKVTYHVTYRFAPLEGAAVQRRAKVGSRFYNAVREGGTFRLRYVADKPAVHELQIGATRAEARATRAHGLMALAGAGVLGLWFGARALPLVRAIARGQVRQARVTGHVEKPSRRKETGGRYGRIRWRDETGEEGESGWVPMLDVAGHPVGSPITVIVDPSTGRSWWEEEFGDDTVGVLQRG